MDVQAWHRQTEHEIACMYYQGFDDGVHAASVAMDRAIDEAVAGCKLTVRQVIDSVLRFWDVDKVRRP